MMETNWNLSAHEQEIIYPLVVGILSHRAKEKVFSNTKIRKILLEFGEEIYDAQIRKIVFHIRRNNDVPLLLANSEGYFIGTNIEEVNEWIETHKGKIEAMKMTLNHIETQLNDCRHKIKNGDNCGLKGQMSIFDIL